jgi:hypothetical protein
MDLKVIEYAVYAAISITLTIWVANTLFRHGRRFLLDVFKGDQALADSVNHLLVVGFYLVNLGYVSLQLKLENAPGSAAEVIEALAGKVGLVLVVLGVMHFGNLFVFTRLRHMANRPKVAPTPPVVPGGAPLPPPAPVWG